MTAQTLHLPYKLRAAADGTLTGICVPYGQVSYLTEHADGERFMPGAFAKSIAARAGKIRLKSLHSEVMPVGVAKDLEERHDGLFGAFRLYDTPEGNAARQRAQEGVYGGLSIEFRPIVEERAKDGVIEVREAALHAVALELDPAYEGARVLAVRAAEKRAEHAWLWEKAPALDHPAHDVDFTRWV